MRILACVLALVGGAQLAACDAGVRAAEGECPVGYSCSSDAPNGLYFVGEPVAGALLPGNSATVVGGTQRIFLSTSDSGDAAFDYPFTPTVEGSAVSASANGGPYVLLRGLGSGSSELLILDTQGDVDDLTSVEAANLASISLAPVDLEAPPSGIALVWPSSGAHVAIALLDAQNNRLVDSSMQVTLPGSTSVAWDTLMIDGLAIGSYDVTVTSAQLSEALTLDIVPGPDAVAPAPDNPASIDSSNYWVLCFAATNQGRYVVGQTWTFTASANVSTADHLFATNCTAVIALANQGVATITASTGGLQTTITLPINASMRTRSAPSSPRAANHVVAGARAAAR